jgi:CheY-like chemotaxis protein
MTGLEKMPSGRKKILFMDDEELLRNVVSRMLEIMGYEVVTASDGAEAIELYREAMTGESPFKAVILDLIVQDGMGGKEAMNELLRIDPDIVALVSSGFVGDTIMQNYRDYGFRGVIPKPYTSEELRDNLARVFVTGMAT